MTPDEFRASLAQCGVSQARLGRLLRCPPSTTSRWALGLRRVPEAVEVILLAMCEGLVTIEQLEAL